MTRGGQRGRVVGVAPAWVAVTLGLLSLTAGVAVGASPVGGRGSTHVPLVGRGQRVASTAQLQGISCATARRCVAVGGTDAPQVFRTTDGGAAWTSQAVSDATLGLVAVSCPTAATCLAEGPSAANPDDSSVFVRSTDGAGTWAQVFAPDRVDPPTCVTATLCYELDSGDPIRTTDGGTTWVPLSLRGWSWIDALACTSVRLCYVTGYRPRLPAEQFGVFYRTSDRIRFLGSMPFDPTTTPQMGLACTSASACMAAIVTTGAERILTTADGGLRWSAHSLPAVMGESDLLGCTGPGHCVLAGTSRTVAITNDDGASWSVPTLPAPSDSRYGPALSCRPSRCAVAEGSTVYLSADDNRTWSSHELP